MISVFSPNKSSDLSIKHNKFESSIIYEHYLPYLPLLYQEMIPGPLTRKQKCRMLIVLPVSVIPVRVRKFCIACLLYVGVMADC